MRDAGFWILDKYGTLDLGCLVGDTGFSKPDARYDGFECSAIQHPGTSDQYLSF
jgi:hypothetical protein